ncbi:MAG: DUF3482 domain-containing protein [Cellvibrionaceae bacterium]
MTASSPHFAVVGHPNKGKSSIVATLAQDDTVYIERTSGSTKAARSFPMKVDNDIIYELIDTPGFQRARATLAWLEHYCNDVSQRQQAVKTFVEQHKDDPQFLNECELLKPVIDGAGIIYVVDGSRPYGSEYEAEMEILRWTGQPSLAVINPIDNDDYVEEWTAALGQYFKIVRVFNAHNAEFSKRINLLEVFGQLNMAWHKNLQQAVQLLTNERKRQHRQASDIIASMLVDLLQHKETQMVPQGLPTDPVKGVLFEKYKRYLQSHEQHSRRKIEETYAHYRLAREEDALDVIDSDLFNQDNWYLLGLDRKQLTYVAAAAGASAGVMVDVATGGHSLLLGSLIGGVAGAASAWKFSDQLAEFSIRGIPTGGKTLSFGPVTHPNFPFVLLGRALRHQHLICLRTHANRNTLTIEENQPLTELSVKDRTSLMKMFKEIAKQKKTIENHQLISDLICTQLLLQDQINS